MQIWQIVVSFFQSTSSHIIKGWKRITLLSQYTPKPRFSQLPSPFSLCTIYVWFQLLSFITVSFKFLNLSDIFGVWVHLQIQKRRRGGSRLCLLCSQIAKALLHNGTIEDQDEKKGLLKRKREQRKSRRRHGSVEDLEIFASINQALCSISRQATRARGFRPWLETNRGSWLANRQKTYSLFRVWVKADYETDVWKVG